MSGLMSELLMPKKKMADCNPAPDFELIVILKISHVIM